MKFASVFVALAAVSMLLSGCDVPPTPTAAAPSTIAANPPAAAKKHHCTYETGSRLCRDADEEVDGSALGSGGSPDIQQGGRVTGSAGLH